MKKTVKDLVNSIPERLGLDLDLSTPKNAYDFLTNEEFPIFFKASGNSSFESTLDGHEDTLVFVCGYKTMYVFNRLFKPDAEISKGDTEKYGQIPEGFAFDVLYDGDVEFEPTDDIAFFEEENIPYIAQKFSKEYADFGSFLNCLSKICKDTQDTITIEYEGKDKKIIIDENGEISFVGDIEIIDDNGSGFAKSLALFLMTFMCSTFEEIEELGTGYKIIDCEEKNIIPKDCGMFFVHTHKAELENLKDVNAAIELVCKYPCVYPALSKDMQRNEDVAIAFIENNAPFSAEYDKLCENWILGCNHVLFGNALKGEVARLELNGVVAHRDVWSKDPIEDDILKHWVSNKKTFKALLSTSMAWWAEIDDEAYKKYDLKEMFDCGDYYIIHLKHYFTNCDYETKEGKKIKEHIQRKYQMLESENSEAIAIMRVYDEILLNYPEYLPKMIRRFNNPILMDYCGDFLRNLTKEQRDKYIFEDPIFAYPIRNELENNDPIVDYICKRCPYAGNILSDEIVYLRGLRREDVEITKLCEECGGLIS